MHIPMERWGKDHYSTLGYIECRIIENEGRPCLQHMRCNQKIHPLLAHVKWEKEYPTRLADGETANDHDDWSCLDDVEAEGLIENIGTSVNRVYRLTDMGMIVVNALRNHKAEGGSFGNFNFERIAFV